MKSNNLTLKEIRITGMEALKEHLGIVGMIRFLQYADKGQGNYSDERHLWLGNPDLKTIEDEIKQIKSKK
ncbi:hypothetical protein [Mesoaciditoga lauensis]|uniref:hypothetical protein n=1 Tax=Mesoaciditoga lauensis TaxID=1495039 RepID=UPI00056D114B|nr:hypothetical protein [Mesoaciditoga lauensis]